MPVRTLKDYIAVRKPAPIVQNAQPERLAIKDEQTRNPVMQTVRTDVSPFAGLDVWPSIEGATLITWRQNHSFREQLPFDAKIILEFTYDPTTNNWLYVSESPITYYLTDSVKRFHGQTIQGAYRLRINTPEKEYTSEPTSLFQKLGFTEYRTALRIIRAENRQIYHKSPGYLLKRRWMGVRCNRCNNPLTNTVTEDQCPICFGTGFIGGYFSPVQCGMEITLSGSGDKVDPGRGPINDGLSQGRITAIYCPEQNDVWVDSMTGSRYRLVGHEVICHERSVPLVLMAQLKHIPASDIVYSVKLE